MTTPRRSERANKGKSPARFGEWLQEDGALFESDVVMDRPNAESRDFPRASASKTLPPHGSKRGGGKLGSRSSRRSNSSTHRRTLQAEIEAAEEVARLTSELAESKLEEIRLRREIKAQQLEARCGIIEKRLELRRVEIMEEASDVSQGSRSSGSECSENVDGHSKVHQWLNRPADPPHSTPIVHEGGKDLGLMPSTAAVDQLTDAFAKAMKNATSQSPSGGDMKRFMARHSSSKDLPTFSGEPEEWPGFISYFRQTTELCGYSNTENMARLQKCLKGAARDAVRAFMVVPDNVDRVIKTLERRFGRPEFIIGALIDKVRKMTAPKDNDFETLIQFADAVQNLHTTLETLKSANHIANPQLLREVVEKLPSHLRMDWGRHLHSVAEEANLKTLAQWLEEVADAACLVSVPKHTDMIKEETPSKKLPEKRREDKAKKRETVLATTEEANDVREECLFCKKTNHEVGSCRKFKELVIDKRWEWAKDKKICFVCLKAGHRVSKCKEKKPCDQDGCERMHHQLLHYVKKSLTQGQPEVVGHTSQPRLENRVLLKVLPVTVTGPKGAVQTHALLDDGSTVSLIDKKVASKIGVVGPRETLTVQWTNDTTRQDSDSERVTVSIAGSGGEKFTLKARTMNDLLLPVQSVKIKTLAHRWNYLQQAKVVDLIDARPTILIGQDNCSLTLAHEIIEGPKNGPVLSHTKLGWVVHGNVAALRAQRTEVNLCMCLRESPDHALQQMVSDSFKTDNFGVQVPKNPICSREENRASTIMEQTTRRVGERWETGLLWRRDDVSLPKSEEKALQRLRSIEKKMDKNPEFAQQYCKKIDDYLSKGYARKLPPEEARQTPPKTWYLPHFAVVNDNKPGKLRLVFDAAAHGEGTSLNEALLKGPDMLSSLPGVLCKLRQKKIGFTADIKEMFHQVRIRSEDLPAQRFLWRGMDRDRDPDKMEMSVMVFGATCSPTSAQFVKNKNANEFRNQFPEAVEAIVNRHYVDDYLDSTHTEEEAIQLITEVIGVHKQGGFIICNWNCSSRKVLQHIPEELRTTGSKSMDLDAEIPIERVLGLKWDPNSDVFQFSSGFGKIDPGILSGKTRPTKREVLKVVMSVFDPLGFVAHFMIKAKVLLQDVWRSGIGWDDELTDRLDDKWKNWLQELSEIDSVKVPRCYSTRMIEVTSLQFHVFCDASEEAFAAVAYLRVELKDEIQVALVMAKTRVAPLRPMSIPRLELQAAVMGSRLARTIQEMHSFETSQTVFWTDSRTVLCWLKSDARKFKPFVAHRVGEIEELTDGASWHWVPTQENVADDATRSGKPTDFQGGHRWWTGPSFLRTPETEWPKATWEQENEAPLEEQELKKEFVAVTVAGTGAIPDINRFSSWLKLVRATAWMLRFIKCCREKARSKQCAVDQELTPSELLKADALWCKQAQLESFPEEWSRVNSGQPVSPGSQLNQLTPLMDSDGCLRVGGRIGSAKVNEEMKQPVILHPKHTYTRLLIQHHHVQAGHAGQELVVNELRQRYWILNIRTAVRSAWNSCLHCRAKRARPQVPQMGSLPRARLASFERPFTHTGMDYFGPMEVTIGRRHEKRYGVLFTCLTTRAVHLEIAASLTTDSAIMSIRRMIGRRGEPKCLYSDNGTNLRGAEKELQAALKDLDQAKIGAKMSARAIEWHFNPPSAPHMGGSWERMVRSVKVALRSTLHERAPREEVLQTLFVEAENIVNSRPLTHVSVDADDPESLTPNHFLLGTSSGAQPPGNFNDRDLCLRKQWRVAQRLADHFWKRWVREYLPTLTRKTKWFRQVKPVQVNDLVIIADGNLPRNQWPRGIVIQVYPGKDGNIRVVDVRTTSGVFRRPVAKLCRLDVSPMER